MSVGVLIWEVDGSSVAGARAMERIGLVGERGCWEVVKVVTGSGEGNLGI